MDEKEEEDDDNAASNNGSTARFSPGDRVNMIPSLEALINTLGRVPPEAVMNVLGTNDMGLVRAVSSANKKVLTVESVAGDKVHVSVLGSVGSGFVLPARVLEPVSEHICMVIWSSMPSAISFGLILARAATSSCAIAVCGNGC